MDPEKKDPGWDTAIKWITAPAIMIESPIRIGIENEVLYPIFCWTFQKRRYIIEDAFKQMKDRKIGIWWPMFHWTNQMIQVHGLYCSLSLLLRALVIKKVKNSGITLPVNKLHEKLWGIREVLNVFSNSRKTRQSVVSKMDEIQQRLFDLFNMKRYLLS